LNRVVRFLGRTPVQSFLLLPLAILIWELWWQGRSLKVEPLFLLLMPWGFLQYRLCGRYRIKRGGGGPGLEKPPERLVVTGPYAYTRNPMYLGHIICLLGITLALNSVLGAVITAARALWFHYRVRHDERRLAEQFGAPYIDYQKRVKRWIPGLL
jgi:protein-S-isoprenylcysteine O-methyltransferase Ste14